MGFATLKRRFLVRKVQDAYVRKVAKNMRKADEIINERRNAHSEMLLAQKNNDLQKAALLQERVKALDWVTNGT